MVVHVGSTAIVQVLWLVARTKDGICKGNSSMHMARVLLAPKLPCVDNLRKVGRAREGEDSRKIEKQGKKGAMYL